MKLENDLKAIMDGIESLRISSSRIGVSSAWIQGLIHASAYVRFFHHPVLRPKPTVVISNISVCDPGQGWMSCVLPHLKEKCDSENWFLEFENVINARFLRNLLREEFFIIPDSNPVCVRYCGDNGQNSLSQQE